MLFSLEAATANRGAESYLVLSFIPKNDFLKLRKLEFFCNVRILEQIMGYIKNTKYETLRDFLDMALETLY